MSSAGAFKAAPIIRPHLSVCSIFDQTTGRYYRGALGEAIHNAGLANFTGVAGLPNMFKTAIALFQIGCAMVAHPTLVVYIHDSENTLTRERVIQAIRNVPGGQYIEDLEERVFMSDASVYLGDEWFEDFKKFSKSRRDDPTLLMTTPFYNHKAKEHVKSIQACVLLLDSLSGLNSEKTETMYDKNGLSESGLNMVNMASSNVKSRMIDQMTGLTSASGIHAIMAAHVGEQYQLNQYAPAVRKLRFLKGDLKLKKVPENFSFLTGNCWLCSSITPMLDKDKNPEYPRDDEEFFKGETDLLELTIINLRGKFGPSNIPLPLVISQSEGVKPGLSDYNLLKTVDRFGIGGNAQNYYLDLLPEVKLNRKSIRSEIDRNAKLQRALQFSSDICQIKLFKDNIDKSMIPTMAELYGRLKEKGYDWDLLLNTRGYWIYKEESSPLEYLSAVDLLRMYHGFYHPYWYPKSAEELGITVIDDTPVSRMFGFG